MTYQSFHFLLHENMNWPFAGFVFFSTLCSYSFHWYLTAGSVIPSPRIEWMKYNRQVHTILFFTGLIGAACFFYYLLPVWPWLLVAAVATFLYSAPKIPHPLFRALRKVALGKTIFLAFVWMYVTTILPILVSGKAWNISFTYFAISRFFLVYAICILFDFRDRQDDKAAGIRSLITYLSEKNITSLFYFSIIVFLVSTLLLLSSGYSTLSVLLLLVPGIITAALYNYARTHFDDMFYYLLLDGLMALSAGLMLIAGI